MLGEATIVPRADGCFDYREQGRLTLPSGQILDAERRYIFAGEDDGFTVLFAEAPPHLFHRVALRREGSNLVGTGAHLCGADRYDTRYEFGPAAEFAIEHCVTGPRKRYLMITRYTRG